MEVLQKRKVTMLNIVMNVLSRAQQCLQKGLLWVEKHFYHQLKVQFISLKSFFFSSFFKLTIQPLSIIGGVLVG